MTVAITKKVKYSPNERLDLLDKLAEDTLDDITAFEWMRGLIADDPDGRVIFGWHTATVTGPNLGFTVPAEKGLAFARDGSMLVMDGSTALTSALVTSAINYVHGYFDEVDSDTDARRFYIGGTETSQNTPTRITRTVGLRVTTVAYAAGTPPFSGFQASANIGGTIRQLVPLFAVAVDSSNVITGVFDYRPMFGFGQGTTTFNKYNAPGGQLPDFPHNFTVVNLATLGITGIRSGLVALADRIKNLKNTTNWYDPDFSTIIFDGTSGGIRKSVNNDFLFIAGGNTSSSGANIELYGGTHATQANRAWFDASRHTFRPVSSALRLVVIESSGITTFGDPGIAGRVVMLDDTGTTAAITQERATSAAAFVSGLEVLRARGSLAARAIVANGDTTLSFTGYGWDGASYRQSAHISAEIDGVPGVADMPGRLAFYTTPDGSATPLERLRITNNGNIGINTTTPGARLVIVGTGATSATLALAVLNSSFAPLFYVRNDGNVGINTTTPGERLTVVGAGATSATTALGVLNSSLASLFFVRNDGNVGIGTITPDFGLDVERTIGNTTAKFGASQPIYTITADPSIGFNLYYNGGWKFGAGSTAHYGAFMSHTTTTGTFSIQTTESVGTADAVASPTLKMAILSTGQFGFNTSPDVGVMAQFSITPSLLNVFRIAKTDAATVSGPYLEVINQRNDSNNTFGGRIGLSHWRSDGAGSYSANSLLGAAYFGGLWGSNATYDNARNLYSAGILAFTSESRTSASNLGTYLVFRTSANATASLGKGINEVNSFPGTERLRVSQEGFVGINTAQLATGVPASRLHVVGDDAVTEEFIFDRYGTVPPTLLCRRALGTPSTPVSVINGDRLGNLLFEGYTASAFWNAARISVEVDGTPGAGDMPGRITFSTTPDGGAAPLERLVVTSDGVVRPFSALATSLGTVAIPFGQSVAGYFVPTTTATTIPTDLDHARSFMGNNGITALAKFVSTGSGPPTLFSATKHWNVVSATWTSAGNYLVILDVDVGTNPCCFIQVDDTLAGSWRGYGFWLSSSTWRVSIRNPAGVLADPPFAANWCFMLVG